MNYKRLNNLTGWAVFAVAAITYLSTMEPTVSLWDCGEYIATANGLQVGHPPGAPLFNMLGRLFSAFVAPDKVAMMINSMSALASAFTILFLFWTITYIAKKLAQRDGDEFTDARKIAVIGSGVIGALAYTFSDSFWFSAVEGEVYALSSFFTAIVVWAIFKWDEVADEPDSDRWLVFIMFLIGLSIGVHLLNLLAIPAMGFVYYFRKYQFTTKGFFYAGAISILVLGIVQGLIIPGMVSFPATIERMFVNSFGMPFGSGTIFFFLIVIALVVYGLNYSHKYGKKLLNTLVMSFTVLVIGYSCFGMIIIRSQANTPIDENNPENMVNLLAYLNREQYGSWPILNGPYWNSEITGSEDGNPVFMRGYAVKRGEKLIKGFRTEAEANDYFAKKGLTGAKIQEEYFVADDRKGTEIVYNPKHTTLFPRMFSRDPRHINGYQMWSGYDGKSGQKYTDRRTGEVQVLPTFGNNLQFFFNYQMGWMYWRYFMWNFSGRQNDEQNVDGNPLDGNFLTGVKFIDDQLVGDQEKVPSSITSNKAHNKFFMLPLILGLIGMFWQLIRDPKNWFIVFLLFFFTGVAIIIYLNPKPFEPRERDYAYAGSFYAYAIWIGLGVISLFDMVKKLRIKDLTTFMLATAVFIGLIYTVESMKGSSHAFSFSLFYSALVAFALIAFMVFVMGNMKNQMTTALASVIIGLPVPYVMAADGWDDHDRSGRTGALDLAWNYLQTCEPNAILFTHGDNDTFPLWYAQEVEGIRRDVRVVNLSLLGTDWYIDQMMRKAYESEPVPFTMPEYLYRQGGPLDQVIFTNSEKNPLDLKFAIDSARDDNNHETFSGSQYAVMGTNNFFLKVDKEKVLASGVVPEDKKREIVDSIRFTVPKSYLLKNDFFILDLVAHSDWKRPIYFAGTADDETYVGLQNHFSLEGLNYKFVPIKHISASPNVYGKVDTDRMYKNMMEVYRWGGMDKEGVYVDYYTRRLTNNYRLQFLNLASALADEGIEQENESRRLGMMIQMTEDSLSRGGSAVVQDRLESLKSRKAAAEKKKEEKFAMSRNVVKKCYEVMPKENVPYDRITPSFVGVLYQIGDDTTAIAILKDLMSLHDENLNYYYSVGARYSMNMMESINISRRIMMMMYALASQQGDEALVKEIEQVLTRQDIAHNNWAGEIMKYEPREGGAKLMRYFPELFQSQ